MSGSGVDSPCQNGVASPVNGLEATSILDMDDVFPEPFDIK
jgi:hypothetical protein